MKQESTNLHNSRVECTINDLISKDGLFCDGDWIESKDQNPNGEVRLIQLADIGDGEFKNKSDRFLTYQKSIELNCTFLKEDDILIARLPEPLGRACIFPLEGEKRFVTAVDVCIVRPQNQYVDIKYLLYTINSPNFRIKINEYETGTTRKRISRTNLAKIRLPLAPLPEQRAIVAKIEQYFSELDNGIASLKKAQEQLKVYRQAVLKWAFEGKLTNENVIKGELPEGWQKKKLAQLGELICGQSPSIKDVNTQSKGMLYVTGPEQWNGNHIEENKWTENPKRVVPDGTIFITVKGAGVGKIFPGKHCAIGRDIYAYKPKEDINFSYIFWALRYSIDEVIRKAQGDIPGLSKNHILDHFICISSKDEQQTIVQEIETCFSVCDKLEEIVSQSLDQAEFLRQSILKRAFEGKLLTEVELQEVRNAPDWEPAEKLLERIKNCL